jgi:SAM-dependent methyltransferase
VENARKATRSSAAQAQAPRRVLNAGSGFQSARQLHPAFTGERWQQVRLDINPDANPDIVATITDMRTQVPTASFDAVWCSHALEHLYAHEVPSAITEFRRILRPDGFLLVRSPDLEAAASLIVEHGTDYVAYQSPAGPVTPLDMLFGYAPSIARGNVNMSHKTGFTSARLGKLLAEANFTEVMVKQETLELWALAFMEKSDRNSILNELQLAGLDLADVPD